jgi:hypothetical protein
VRMSLLPARSVGKSKVRFKLLPTVVVLQKDHPVALMGREARPRPDFINARPIPILKSWEKVL